jgi:hypothetical protein
MAKANSRACKALAGAIEDGDGAFMGPSSPLAGQVPRGRANCGGNAAEPAPMALDLNDPNIEFSDLVEAYLTWTLAVLNDEKLDGDKLLTEEIAEDGFNAMRFLPDVVTSAIETTLARVYDVDPEELSALLYPEE